MIRYESTRVANPSPAWSPLNLARFFPLQLGSFSPSLSLKHRDSQDNEYAQPRKLKHGRNRLMWMVSYAEKWKEWLTYQGVVNLYCVPHAAIKISENVVQKERSRNMVHTQQ
jgi:hypothetical protein